MSKARMDKGPAVKTGKINPKLPKEPKPKTPAKAKKPGTSKSLKSMYGKGT